MQIINEDIPSHIKEVIDSGNITAKNKHGAIVKLLRNILNKGGETGLESSKPKKGSSRAVYFPSEHDEFTIDGKKSKVPTALKIAFPGFLDRYNKTGKLLGEHQNLVEGNSNTHRVYGILRQDENGHYHTNPDGVLAPVFHAHEDGHYLQSGRVDPLKAAEFTELTKNEQYPKGIKHKEFAEACDHEWDMAHGRKLYDFDQEKHERVTEHPFVANVISLMLNTKTHPGDFNMRNMGVWENPSTGKRHIVLADSGFAGDVVDHYNACRKNHIKAHRRY